MNFEGTFVNPVQSPKVTVNENILFELRIQEGFHKSQTLPSKKYCSKEVVTTHLVLRTCITSKTGDA